jgi:hypothetical protein
MRKVCCLLAVPALVLGVTGLVRSGAQPGPREIIDKAIKAHGGAEALDKFKAVTFKVKGTSYAVGDGVPYTGDFSIQGAEQMRMDLVITFMGQELKFVQVVNRNKGWRINPGSDKTEALGKGQLEEQREQMYAGSLAHLSPLRDKAFKLSALGEAQVAGRPAVGVRVERQGKRPVNLFFDKTSGLLVKSEYTVKDEMAGDREVMQEVLYKDYKTFAGTKQATRVNFNRDGKRYSEGEVTAFERHESLDDSAFAEP